MTSGRFQDLSGKVYGSLMVISRAPNSGHYVRWLCLCDCGNRVVTRAQSLRDGKTKSCGCKYDGRSNTATYSSWSSMKKRCLNPKAARSEERRVGKACVSTCRCMWARDH